MKIFNFVVLSVIIAPYNVQISKTQLPIVSLNVRELELNQCSKEQSRKKGTPAYTPLREGSKSPSPCPSPKL